MANGNPASSDNPVAAIENVPALTVSIGSLPTTPSALWNSYADETSNGIASVITDYQVQNHYESDEHTYMAGLTSPGGFNGASVGFFRLASTTLLWIADWTASRWNEQPPVPDWNLNDANWVLLDKHITTTMVGLNADGTVPRYRISGTYFYGCKNPNAQIYKDVVYPLHAATQNVFDRSQPLNSLIQNIINSKVHSAAIGGLGLPGGQIVK